MTEERAETVVVGGGPAGLAVAACLRRAGRQAVVLERGDRVGWSWSLHYDALRLHTVRGASGLPFAPLPRAAGRYPSRDDLLAYLEDYAERFRLDVRLGTAATAVRRRDDGLWQTDAPPLRFVSRHLVLATGANARPHLPDLPGRKGFRGRLLHSSQFRRGVDFRGQRVLVAGLGNSGADLAAELHRAGATVALAVRGPVHALPAEIWGINWRTLHRLCPDLLLSVGARLGPRARETALQLSARAWEKIQRRTCGDLERLGLRLATAEHIAGRWRGLLPPVVHDQVFDLLRQGELALHPGLAALTATGARFEDGSEEPFDAVVLATGFRPAWGELLAPGVSDQGDQASLLADGPWDRPHPTRPGLFLCGHPPELRHISRSARRIARAISGDRG
ncbi:MAG TPA: NAD(P)/FAD-dependent oxidoreductase [Thermoanaerobaculia bacterium]|nr:NAD(P)/FAD-dependent oxidoreductase [Thermoanaerobaculia bacterium]